jgi:superfamily II RNA helicase
VATVRTLESEDLLPAIFFIFSRAGCDRAVAQLARRQLRLTGRAERAQLREIVAKYADTLTESDRKAIGWDGFSRALLDGYAAHHAGLLPVCKAVVEEAFSSGALKVVFATETLALGVNMPARSVVIEKLVKYNGTEHKELTPGEYTQLTGRAGRRGIDTIGHAVVLWASDLDPKWLAGLAGSRTFALNSSFVPSYNMAVNLIGGVGMERARNLLLRSFAQFQAEHARRRRRIGLVKQFEQVCGVLHDLGYLNDDDTVTEDGKLLSRVYNELDLVVVEALGANVFEDLNESQLAAVLSSLVFEARRESPFHREGAWPDGPSERAYKRLRKVYRAVLAKEREHGIEPTRRLSEGFAQAAFDWAAGDSLAVVLQRTGLAPGDLVRWVRQIIDLGQQLVRAPGVPEPLVATAKQMVAAMRRDIIDLD